MVRFVISVLEWPALVRLFHLPDARARYPEFYAALARAVLSVELPPSTAAALHIWLRERAIHLGVSPRPSDRTDGLHLRDVAETLKHALSASNDGTDAHGFTNERP
jgi:hypothetical protein